MPIWKRIYTSIYISLLRKKSVAQVMYFRSFPHYCKRNLLFIEFIPAKLNLPKVVTKYDLHFQISFKWLSQHIWYMTTIAEKSYVRILLLKQMHELSHKTLIRFFLMISMWTFKSAFFLSTERVILFAFGCSPSHNNFSLTSRVWKKRWTNKHSGMRKVSLSSDNAPWFY